MKESKGSLRFPFGANPEARNPLLLAHAVRWMGQPMPAGGEELMAGAQKSWPQRQALESLGKCVFVRGGDPQNGGLPCGCPVKPSKKGTLKEDTLMFRQWLMLIRSHAKWGRFLVSLYSPSCHNPKTLWLLGWSVGRWTFTFWETWDFPFDPEKGIHFWQRGRSATKVAHCWHASRLLNRLVWRTAEI